jgi:hypothetical protein
MGDMSVFGRKAALGGLVAVGVLASGSGLKADELADLRANNALLQQRIDQAKEIASEPGAIATAPLHTGSFPRSFLVPGTDTSIRIGGSVTEIGQYSRR